jgi:DNA-directed RNA polymerase specialized sigma24 family protein
MRSDDPTPGDAPSTDLDVLMARMGARDGAAVFAFVAEYGGELARVVRSILGKFGRSDLLRSPDEVDFLVQSAALAIYDRAAGWKSGGAPPWVWAGLAIRAAVVRDIGHPTVDVDDERFDGRREERRGGSCGDVDLDALAARHDGFRQVRGAIAAVASERDREVVEQFLVQQSSSDPSPSHTVAAEAGLSSANVRQIVSRTRRRVRLHLEATGTEPGVLGPDGWLGP